MTSALRIRRKKKKKKKEEITGAGVYVGDRNENGINCFTDFVLVMFEAAHLYTSEPIVARQHDFTRPPDNKPNKSQPHQ